MELCRIESMGVAEEGEALAAARRAKEEDRLKSLMGRPSGGKGGDFSQGGKTRKGKEKGGSTGKGSTNEGNRGKGGQGGKEESRGAWQKKKD